MLDKFDRLQEAVEAGQVIMMDTGALVGATSADMDVALGQRLDMERRRSL